MSNFGSGSAFGGGGGGAASGPALFPIHPPTEALFNLSNLASGAAVSINAGPKVYSIKRTDTGSVNVDRQAFQGKAVPAGSSWTATLGFWSGPFGRNGTFGFHRPGICVLENATGKALSLTYDTNNNAPQVQGIINSNLTTVSSAYTSGPIFGGRQPWFFQVVYDGTNYVFKVSYDFMQTWDTVATLAKATYFTSAADRVGVCIETYTTFNAGEPRADIFYYVDPDFP